MYAGHAALALFAKGKRPRIPIAFLVPIAFGPDWIDLASHLLHHPTAAVSHSIVSVAIGSTAAALVYVLWRGAGSDAVVVWLTYASHWPADYLTGLKPTWPGGPRVGLMLYSRPAIDVAMESVLVLACWLAYRRSLPPEARRHPAAYLVPIGLIAMQFGFTALEHPGLGTLASSVPADQFSLQPASLEPHASCKVPSYRPTRANSWRTTVVRGALSRWYA